VKASTEVGTSQGNASVPGRPTEKHIVTPQARRGESAPKKKEETRQKGESYSSAHVCEMGKNGTYWEHGAAFYQL